MDQEIIQLLKSSNPDDRIEGINRLAESGHPDSVKILAAFHKKETDLQVKSLAEQVARELKEGAASEDIGGIFAPEKPKREEKFKISVALERVSWAKAIAGIGIYALLAAILFVIPMFLLSSLITAFVAMVDPDLPELTAGILFGLTAIFALIYIITIYIGVFIQYGLVHFSATRFLKGEGYFTNLLWNIRIPLIAQLIAQTIVGGIILAVGYSTLTSLVTMDTATFQAVIETGDLSYIPGLQEDMSTLQLINWVNYLITAGFYFWIAVVIGKTYKFGGGNGCLSYIIANLILGAFVFCAVVVTIAATISTLSQYQ